MYNGTIFTLNSNLGIIKLLSEISGIGDYSRMKANAISAPAFERTVWILDLPALIQAKRAAGRPKDPQVLPELEALLEARER